MRFPVKRCFKVFLFCIKITPKLSSGRSDSVYCAYSSKRRICDANAVFLFFSYPDCKPSVLELHQIGNARRSSQTILPVGNFTPPQRNYFIFYFFILYHRESGKSSVWLHFFFCQREIDVKGTTVTVFAFYSERKLMFFKHGLDDRKP